MKVCEICEKTEACVEVKHYENGQFRELNLCAACAQSHGLNLPANLADVLLESALQEISEPAVENPDGEDASRRCPACNMRLVDFRKSGRLGCSECYAAWQDVLEPMLMGMHRSLFYTGEPPAGLAGNAAVLQKELMDAIAREDYEEAAHLRDCLRDVQEVTEGRQGEFSFNEADETAI